MKNTKTRWILIAVVSALVAIATTALVLVLRARAKKKEWYDEDCIDFDVDEDNCLSVDEADAVSDEPANDIVEE